MTVAEPRETDASSSSSILGKASHMLKNIIGHDEEQGIAGLNESPRSLAVKRNEMEAEFIDKMAEVNTSIMQLEFRLNQLQPCESTPEIETQRTQLVQEIETLKKEAAAFSAAKLKLATDLDTKIGQNQQQDMAAMNLIVAKFKRIEVTCVGTENRKTTRTLKPVRYFSDLQAQVETYNPGARVVLSIPGTGQYVGSQFELYCAYEDATDAILRLDLKLYAKIRKRTCADSDIDDLDIIDRDNFVRHVGVWNNTEVQLFKNGVEQYGWGKWAEIAATIQTRDRKQVQKFSLNHRAKKFRSSANLVSALTDLAEGFKVVARGLEMNNGIDDENGDEIDEEIDAENDK